MKSKKIEYLVMAKVEAQPEEQEGYSVVNPFWDNTVVCNTVKQAYRIGIWLTGLVEPDCTYRKTADTLREKGVVYISSKENLEEVRIVIAKVKKY